MSELVEGCALECGRLGLTVRGNRYVLHGEQVAPGGDLVTAVAAGLRPAALRRCRDPEAVLAVLAAVDDVARTFEARFAALAEADPPPAAAPVTADPSVSSRPLDLSDLVNVTMMAERAGVPRTNANAWTRSAGFPKPVADIGGRVYWWSQVRLWLATRRPVRDDESP